MPAIPTNAVRTMPNAVPNFASVQPDQTGAALQKVGEVGYQIGGEMLQKAVTREEQDQQAKAAEWAANTRKAWLDRVTTLQQEAPADPTGFHARVDSEFSSYSEKILAQPNLSEYQRRVMKAYATDIGESLSAHALAFEAEGKAAFRRSQIGTTLDQLQNVLQRDPTQFDSLFVQGQMAIESAGLTGQERMAQEKSWRNDSARSVLLGRLERDPARVISDLDSGTFDDRLDPSARASIYNAAQSAVKQREVEGRARIAEAKSAVDHVRGVMEAGLILAPEMAGQVDQIVAGSGSSEVQSYWTMLLDTNETMKHLARMSPVEAANIRDANFASALNNNGTTPAELDRYNLVNRFIENQVTALKNDSMDVAIRNGVVSAAPIDFTSADTIAQSLALRMIQATKVQEVYKVPASPLKGVEVSPLTQRIMSMQPDEVQKVVSMVRPALEAATNSNDVSIGEGFLKMIGQESPAMAFAMGMPDYLANGRMDVINGLRLIANKAVEFPARIDASIIEQLRPVMYQMGADTQGQMVDAVKAVVAMRINKGATGDETTITSAIESILGEIDTHNGGSYIVPHGVTGDDFQRALMRLNDEDMKIISQSGKPPVDPNTKQPIPANMLERMLPVSVGGNLFSFVYPGTRELVKDADNRSIILTLDASNINVLSSRRRGVSAVTPIDRPAPVAAAPENIVTSGGQ